MKHCAMIEILPRLNHDSAAAADVWPWCWLRFVASDACKQATAGLETNGMMIMGVGGK
jgi:hypothetical protein